MSIVRVGTTKQYADNWDNIFGGSNSRAATKKNPAKSAKPSAKKKAVTKKTATRPVKKARKKK
jgi:hypothetical protein